ncbi:efflux RND transporter periplasmic adaptor subunit [Nevskia ramosa]|uniref:efflux RND transporter periplasmic adaptor subunit n=1 Tax=Nevskia ramosa TaxID=64002 RepID=UPI0003B7B99D|nr:biotin/lipoyl-binding protein [Nevskia ramosa]
MNRLQNPKFDPSYSASFTTLEQLAPPRPTRSFARLILVILVLLVLALSLTPWIQTAAGTGQIIALDPTNRVQSVTASLSGRIKQWHVQEGSRVKQGDPLVELTDNDPRYTERLQAELDAARAALEARRTASEIALIDVERRQRLFEKGLAARRDLEAANIRWRELKASEASAMADVVKAQTAVSRQQTQLVTAPRDGTILKIFGGDTSTFVKEGEALVSFAPVATRRATELFVSGLDAVLIAPGRDVRLSFEGWPSVQFSGWPSVAVGTFPGVVQFVDPAVSINGRYRVVVAEKPGEPWPDERFLRLGGRAQGWVLLNEVKLGYEIWRQLNYFPPEPTPDVKSTGNGASK